MSGWPRTVNGRVYTKSDFEPFGYTIALPELVGDLIDHVLNVNRGVSASSIEIGTGTKNLVILAANGQIAAFQVGARVLIADALDPATNTMTGIITSIDAVGNAEVEVDGVTGSGTKTSWYVNFSGEKGAATGASNTATYVTVAGETGSLANSKQLGGRYGARVLTSGSNIYVEGERKPTAVTGTTHSQVAADREAVLRFTNAAGCAVTLLRPHDSSGAPNNAPTGFATWIDAVGGAVTCTPSTGTVSHDGVTGAASFVFPKGSYGLIESAGGDVWIAHILRHSRQQIEVTASTLTVDRTHNGAAIDLNRAGGVAVTLPATDGLGIGPDFEVTLVATAVTATHTISRAGSNVFDLAGGPTSIALQQGDSVVLRSNGGTGAAGIWTAIRIDRVGIGAAGQVLKADGTVRAWGALTNNDLPNGAVIDTVYAEVTTSSVITGGSPALDDTVPLSSEGTQILSAALTTKQASNKVRGRVLVHASAATGGWEITLFVLRGSTVVGAGSTRAITSDTLVPVGVEFQDSPGSAAEHTYTVRIGSQSPNVAINGISSGRRLGGSLRAVLALDEIKAA